MLRFSILAVFLVCVWTYAFRDWFVSLCALILFTALTQNPNLRWTFGDIPGLNPWNITLLLITLAWAMDRLQGQRPWAMPPIAWLILVSYILIIVTSYVRLAFDLDSIPAETGGFATLDALSDYLINPMKYLVAGLLLADGCRTRARMRSALATVLLLGVVYGLLVLKHVPITELAGGGNMMRNRHLIDKLIGLHANDMGKVLTATLWGLFVSFQFWSRPDPRAGGTSTSPRTVEDLAGADVGATSRNIVTILLRFFATFQQWTRLPHRNIAVACGIVLFLGMALCFSRAAYLTFVALGFCLACIRWHKLLLIAPIAMVVILIAMPGIIDRMSMGFSDDDLGGSGTNWDVVTAGRSGMLWPPVIEEIGRAPLFGYGRLAMFRTDVYDVIQVRQGVVPTSPHNGYLEILLESGLVGLVSVLAVYLGVVAMAIPMIRRSNDPLQIAVGGLGLVFSLGCLITAMSGAMLLPDQGQLSTMCAFALTLRLWCDRRTARMHADAIERQRRMPRTQNAPRAGVPAR